MKKFILPVVCLLMLSACNPFNRKSENEIRAEAKLEMAQEQLAEAQKKLSEMEANKTSQVEERVEQTPAAAPAPVSASTVDPLHKGSSHSGGGTAWGTDFDWLSERYVTYDDLEGCDGGWLRILRNSIYARHGYKFKSADLQRYFGQFSWYHPQYSDVDSKLSAIEKANVKEIKKWE